MQFYFFNVQIIWLACAMAYQDVCIFCLALSEYVSFILISTGLSDFFFSLHLFLSHQLPSQIIKWCSSFWQRLISDFEKGI